VFGKVQLIEMLLQGMKNLLLIQPFDCVNCSAKADRGQLPEQQF
jgi:hypothetical protein